MKYNPGSLVSVRGRDWVVLPSIDPDLVLLKPLGGTEDEVTGIYLPLKLQTDLIRSAEFSLPDSQDIGDYSTALTLFDASRLSFRNGAGPFRSLAKLSFRPRAYQMIPLIMTLKMKTIRLLVADDVGIGKTIEALLIIREMLDRRIISRFAVLCLPHLCEQWQMEIKSKLDLDAVIIRSNTQAALDREIQGDTSVYAYYPFQVISIDYIKSDVRKNVFIEQCPELVILDEAHTCACPSGALKSQQQRHHLISTLAQKQHLHMVLLTATPHSGKPEEFQSLLGLLHPDFATIDLPTASIAERKRLANHFVQRRRADIEKWMGESTTFPKRDFGEFDYQLAPAYAALFNDLLTFIREALLRKTDSNTRMRVHYWTALGLLRGVMSSPRAGIEMLTHRIERIDSSIEEPELDQNPVGDRDFEFEMDMTPTQLTGKVVWSAIERKRLLEFAHRLEALTTLKSDCKAEKTLKIIEDWLKHGFNPVVFCRYIATAKYLGELLRGVLQTKFKHLDIQVVTSEDPDEVRKARIDEMEKTPQRVLIATDCLSEGINLQHCFTAVLHYDLPWNPNRLEQREGRVDRFGQMAPTVKTFLLFAKENLIDGIVLDIIIRKVREIRRSIGISIPFPENSQTILDTVMHAVLVEPIRSKKDVQLLLPLEINSEESPEQSVTRMLAEAAKRESASRSIFSQHAIKANEIERDLQESDEAIGDPEDVENLALKAINHIIGAQLIRDKKGYRFHTRNLPGQLKTALPEGDVLKVSFESPTPDGYLYLGRNHRFIEQLCQFIMTETLDRGRFAAARSAVIKTRCVETKTTILLFRVRNVISDREDRTKIIAEEMLLWGYRGHSSARAFIEHEQAALLLKNADVSGGLTPEAKSRFLQNELDQLPLLRSEFDRIAEDRALHLVEAHERFSRLVDARAFQIVKPVLPMDVMGIYILLPTENSQETRQ